MKSHSFTYQSDIYLQFKELDRTSLRSVVHYFEKNKLLLNQLEVQEYFEILATYASAIFELGQYGKFIPVADEILYLVIDNNIYEFEGEDVYCSMLFKKAASHYNLSETQTAENILFQMIKMYPDNKYVISFYRKIISRQKSISRFTRAAAVALILSSALVIAIELLAIRPFYPTYTQLVEMLRFGLFGLGLLTYLGGEVLGKLTIEWKLRNQLHQIRRLKK